MNDNKVADPTQRNLLHRTHFRKSRTEPLSRVWQWYWSKESPNGNIIADGSEGYGSRTAAFNGYFAGEGVQNWLPVPPEDYVVQKFSEDHWVITKYGKQGESQQDSGE